MIKENHRVQEKIKSLNNARFGSLSEFVFEYWFKGKTLERMHFDKTDFKWDGTAIDIKGRRKFGGAFNTPSTYSGPKYDKIRYVVVDYFHDCIVISENKNILKKMDYISINEIFEQWMNDKILDTRNVRKSNKAINSIKNIIKKFFSDRGHNVRIIYRTTQDSFGKESPDNLLPKIYLKNNITVFLNFKNHSITEDNVKEVFAFKDLDARNFKLINNPHLHKNKVDLDLIDSRYRFKSIKDLTSNWT